MRAACPGRWRLALCVVVAASACAGAAAPGGHPEHAERHGQPHAAGATARFGTNYVSGVIRVTTRRGR